MRVGVSVCEDLSGENAADSLKLRGRSAFELLHPLLFISLPPNRQIQNIAFKPENETRMPPRDPDNASITIHHLHLFPSLKKPSKASS